MEKSNKGWSAYMSNLQQTEWDIFSIAKRMSNSVEGAAEFEAHL